MRLFLTRFLGFVVVLAPSVGHCHAIVLEAENFGQLGGWVVDQQFILEMGSPYLLAHGLGTPVADATTRTTLPSGGRWRVWVRTQDWVAKFGASPAPGTFRVALAGRDLPATLGTNGPKWGWQAAGTVTAGPGDIEVSLRDLSGFEGRCDALFLTDEPGRRPPDGKEALATFRKRFADSPPTLADGGEYDLVVVGGGIAGMCAAVAAARGGLRVALIQDRPVLGGNNSSEVRVWLGGQTNVGAYPGLGNIVRELDTRQKVCPAEGKDYKDGTKADVTRGEAGIALFLSNFVYRVEVAEKRIVSVTSRHIRTGNELRFRAGLFADCTGDGTIGALAGADFDITLSGHMGPTNLWRVVDTGETSPFPRCPWAIDLTDRPFPSKIGQLGKWYWESGFYRDPIAEAELIRDTNFRAMYGAWDALKNARGLYPTHKLAWVAYIAGKRESRRLLGDVILTKKDLVEARAFPDGFVPCTWSIDLHLPDKRYDGGFEGGSEFISKAHYTQYKRPYLVPYRCLYSRNVDNLFMAGRNISVTHEALGAVRVMRTTGMMGEVVGAAAAVARENNATPREVYTAHLDELRRRLSVPPRVPIAPKTKAFLASVGRNVAKEATLSTSPGREVGMKPAVITDGLADTLSNGSRWLSRAKLPNWVELEWARPQQIGALRVVSGYNHGTSVDAALQAFAFQVHEAGAWHNLPGASVSGNTDTDWSTRLPHPVETRRLRLWITQAPGGISRLWEVAVHAPKSPAVP